MEVIKEMTTGEIQRKQIRNISSLSHNIRMR